MYRIKYLPPEGLQFDFIDKSSDIWAIGCILIDLFSSVENIHSLNLTLEEVNNGHDLKIFPTIPSDLHGFMRDIIVKCLDHNYESRIHISQLLEDWNIFFREFNNSKNKEAPLLESNEQSNL